MLNLLDPNNQTPGATGNLQPPGATGPPWDPWFQPPPPRRQLQDLYREMRRMRADEGHGRSRASDSESDEGGESAMESCDPWIWPILAEGWWLTVKSG